MRTETSETEERIGKRTIRAASESMTVVPVGTGRFGVYSGMRGVYTVDLVAGTCSCPDAEHNRPADGCKHLQRTEMELGQREIPDLGRRTDVEIMSGRSRETETRVATDGGTVLDDTPQDSTAETGRPSDCDCSPAFDDDGLGCWPCYRAGYETPNPDAEADDGDDEVSA